MIESVAGIDSPLEESPCEKGECGEEREKEGQREIKDQISARFLLLFLYIKSYLFCTFGCFAPAVFIVRRVGWFGA